MNQNKSSIFLFPLIKGWQRREHISPLATYALGSFEGMLVCVFKSDSEYFDGGIVLSNEDSIHVLYEVDDQYRPDLNDILAGRYSKISDATKTAIASRCDPSIFAKVEGILYKTKDRKKELEDKLGIENIDDYCSEYESKFGEEEVYKIEVEA